MCFGDGDSTSTTVVQPAPQSAEELELIRKQIELSEFQLTELERQRVAQEQFGTALEPFFARQQEEIDAAAAARERQLAAEERLGPIREELLTLAIEDIRRGGAATPEQIELIGEAGGAALEKGLIDIGRFETEGFEGLREELAPSLGLRPSDTPILDRGARLAAEALRQRGQLSQGIRGAQATAQLNFPLASSQLLQTSALGQQRLQEATRQFQEQLRSQAFSNRLAASQTLGGLGLGLAGVPSPGLPSFQRGSTTTQTTTGGGFGLNEVAGLTGGVGGLLSGLGAIGSAGGFPAIFSSRDLKTDKAPVDEDAALETVAELPVETWRYKPGFGLGDERHIGTYAEDFREGFGLGDGATLNLIDTTGVTFAAIKALDKKVKRLEAEGFGLAEAA